MKKDNSEEALIVITNEIYDKCNLDDYAEIDEIREEDDEYMEELEDWISSGLITDDDDAKEWLKDVARDRVYTNKYLRKRADHRLLREGIVI